MRAVNNIIQHLCIQIFDLLAFTGDSMQYGVYPVERDCYQNMNTNYKALR